MRPIFLRSPVTLLGVSHWIIVPDPLRSVRLAPDYGYYDWLFVPAFQSLLPALNFQKLPVTAKSSGCPFDCFFRLIFTDEASVKPPATDLSIGRSVKSF
jgi:hypothetical protein